jgi:hypothetical protein
MGFILKMLRLSGICLLIAGASHARADQVDVVGLKIGMPVEEARRHVFQWKSECDRPFDVTTNDEFWNCRDTDSQLMVFIGRELKVVQTLMYFFDANKAQFDPVAHLRGQFGVQLVWNAAIERYVAKLANGSDLSLGRSGNYWELVVSNRSLIDAEDRARRAKN